MAEEWLLTVGWRATAFPEHLRKVAFRPKTIHGCFVSKDAQRLAHGILDLIDLFNPTRKPKKVTSPQHDLRVMGGFEPLHPFFGGEFGKSSEIGLVTKRLVVFDKTEEGGRVNLIGLDDFL